MTTPGFAVMILSRLPKEARSHSGATSTGAGHTGVRPVAMADVGSSMLVSMRN